MSSIQCYRSIRKSHLTKDIINKNSRQIANRPVFNIFRVFPKTKKPQKFSTAVTFKAFLICARRDSNPQPPDSESAALSICATDTLLNYCITFYIELMFKFSGIPYNTVFPLLLRWRMLFLEIHRIDQYKKTDHDWRMPATISL